jgi:hypothetical protein
LNAKSHVWFLCNYDYSFFENYYPNLVQLYKSVGVEYETLNHSSVFMARQTGGGEGDGGGGNESATAEVNDVVFSVNALRWGPLEIAIPDFAGRSWKAVWLFSSNYIRFGWLAKRYLRWWARLQGDDDGDARLALRDEMTFGEWIEEHHFDAVSPHTHNFPVVVLLSFFLSFHVLLTRRSLLVAVICSDAHTAYMRTYTRNYTRHTNTRTRAYNTSADLRRWLSVDDARCLLQLQLRRRACVPSVCDARVDR